MPDEQESLREKLSLKGVEYLTTAELLALVLRTGNPELEALSLAEQLLQQHGGLRRLARLDYADWLVEVRPAQAAQMMAALELGRRLVAENEAERPFIGDAASVAGLLALEMERHKQEHLRTVLLDAQRRVLAMPTIYIGSLNMTVIRTAEIFREAIARNCASLVLVHNHPSGDPTPSPEDLSLTEHLIKAGRVLDIAILDHVIIGHGRWVSLRDTGINFEGM